jgi:hypothetical protein
MASHGSAETQKLKSNIQDQLTRLLQQLQDLEDLREELEDEEYTETRKDTLEQMEVRPPPLPARGACVRALRRGGHSLPSLFPPHFSTPLLSLSLSLSLFSHLSLRPSALSCLLSLWQEFDGQLKRLMDGDMTLVSELGQLKLALRAAISNAFQTPEVIRSFAAREPAALRTVLARLVQEHKLGRLQDAAYRSKALEVCFALKKLGEELTAEEKALLDSASAQQRKAFEAATEDGAVGEAAVRALAAQR